MLEQEPNAEAPKKDWMQVLDLNRTTAIKSYVDRMERCLRDIDAAREDLKEVAREAKEAEFSPRMVKAMNKVAKLRKDDKKGAAQEELAALEAVGKAVGFDLFSWGETVN